MNILEKFSTVQIWIGCFIGYFCYGLSAILFLSFILPFSFFFILFPSFQYAFLNSTLHNYLFFLTRKLLPILNIYSIKEISGFESIPNGKPVVFVANHRGKLDAPFLLGTLKNTAAVIKLKYAVLPVYSTFVKRLCFIKLDQHSLKTIEKAVASAKEVLSKGKNLLIFPEGTRSSSIRLLPFKDFAFRIARENKTAIVPIVIYSNFAFMAKSAGSFFPNKKNSYTIRCLQPVLPSDNESSSEMAARVREIMTKELNKIEETHNGY